MSLTDYNRRLQADIRRGTIQGPNRQAAKLWRWYCHTYRTPIVVKVNGVDENWAYAPHYNPRHLPVIQESSE